MQSARMKDPCCAFAGEALGIARIAASAAAAPAADEGAAASPPRSTRQAYRATNASCERRNG